jgi:putative hydrolase of the HAD superfamily
VLSTATARAVVARERFGLQESVDELWRAYRRRMPDLVRCRSEVMSELGRLRSAGWRVGIVTNGTADNQIGKIQRTGLADAVDGYALSGVEGVRKPDVGLFEIAAKRCGMSLADGGWMVGDHLVADIAGGNAAGLRTIWIDRGTWPGEEHSAEHVVSDVLETMTILHAEG